MGWPTTLWSTGDLGTAAWANAICVGIDEKSGASASYDFTSIPTVWTHAMIVASLACDSGVTTENCYVRFNGDTTNKYYWQRIRGSATTASAASGSLVSASVIGAIPGNESTGWAAVTAFFPNYSVVHEHTFTSDVFADIAGALYRDSCGGLWNTAAAINRITLTPSGGSWSANSKATLYVMGVV